MYALAFLLFICVVMMQFLVGVYGSRVRCVLLTLLTLVLFCVFLLACIWLLCEKDSSCVMTCSITNLIICSPVYICLVYRMFLSLFSTRVCLDSMSVVSEMANYQLNISPFTIRHASLCLNPSL